MKSFACVLLLAAVVAAEPPLFRQRLRFARQELESADREEAPYPAAGYRPQVEFNLPSRQEVAPPSTSYGVPDDSYRAPLGTYAVPQVVYGVPERKPENENEGQENKEAEEQAEEQAEQREENTKEEQKVEEEAENAKLEEEPKKDSEVVSAQGVYYVLLPSSQLQRVEFRTENDLRNMAYTARLQYRDEDRAPVYVYTAVPQPQTAAYIQLF